MDNCPCGSGQLLPECCGRYLSGDVSAPTAEALMRSRYSAYVLGSIEYVSDTLHPNHRADHDVAAARRWAREADWRGLEVRECQAGGPEDDEGMVEFVVRYRDKGIHRVLHERARFKREDGKWYYTEGDLVMPETQESEVPKVGRNEPCPCGSGKKYKKCCGA